MEKLNHTFHEAIRLTRAGEPVFLDVEVARLNSHSKGDDNRDESAIRDLKKKDPLNVFISNNKETIELWNGKIDGLIVKAIKYSSSPNIRRDKKQLNLEEDLKRERDKILPENSEKRFNKLIYDELKRIFSTEKRSTLIGEDIENNN